MTSGPVLLIVLKEKMLLQDEGNYGSDKPAEAGGEL